ncbi:penicillin-binding protein, partial [Streptomyces sp. TRM76130]|nr:penicillin-binding protein [Streptomyces sp. TRM76130]
SAWFTGFTPTLVTSVGLFGEDAETHGQVPMYGAGGEERVNGGGFPAQIWAAYTFGVMDKTSKFDLDTKQGAAVAPSTTAPPTETASSPPAEETTSAPPTEEETTSAPPTEEETTTTPPADEETTT